jgi:hypothetical protein
MALGRSASRHGNPREEPYVAVTKRPTYLKRQKEQQRLARAAEKREARRARKHSTGTEVEDPDTQDPTLEEPGIAEEPGSGEIRGE